MRDSLDFCYVAGMPYPPQFGSSFKDGMDSSLDSPRWVSRRNGATAPHCLPDRYALRTGLVNRYPGQTKNPGEEKGGGCKGPGSVLSSLALAVATYLVNQRVCETCRIQFSYAKRRLGASAQADPPARTRARRRTPFWFMPRA